MKTIYDKDFTKESLKTIAARIYLSKWRKLNNRQLNYYDYYTR